MRNPEKYNAVHAGGRPKVLSPRDKRLILREVKKNRKISLKQIKFKTNVSASVSTIKRLFQKRNISRKKLKGQPKLSNDHKRRRLHFARDHQTWDEEWSNILFSDEKKWNLYGPDGYQYYWSDSSTPKMVFSKRQNSGGGIMVWGAISANGKLPLVIMNGKFNAAQYVQMVDEACLFEEGSRLCGQDFVFQQDNALIHTARATTEYFHAMGINVLPWPAQSPDVNPIENAWGWLTRQVYKDGKQYNTVADLKTAILKAWEEIPGEYLHKLISSTKNKIFELINRNGKKTHY